MIGVVVPRDRWKPRSSLVRVVLAAQFRPGDQFGVERVADHRQKGVLCAGLPNGLEHSSAEYPFQPTGVRPILEIGGR